MENEQEENLGEEFCSDARRKSCPIPEAYSGTSRIEGKDEQRSSGAKEPSRTDFELDWIYAQYEEGISVAAIAKELGKSESYIYAHMKQRPKKYEDVKKIREEIYNRIIRRVRGVADKITLEYVESLSKIITDPDADEDKKAKAFCDMDKVLRIAKQYSDRVLLAEGKATENLGIGGMNESPFKVIITKTYDPPLPDTTEDKEREDND